jgi:hypothetical protein
VAWTEIYYNIQRQLPSYDIILKKSMIKGVTFEHDRVDSINKGTGFVEHVRLAASGNNVYALWVNGTIVPGNYHDLTDIVFTKSIDFGNGFDKVINISNYTGWSSDPEMSVSGSNVYVVWDESLHEKARDIMFKRSNNNGTTFENHIVNLSNSTSEDSFNQQIAELADKDNIYVVWNENITGNTEIFLRRSTDGGDTFHDTVNLSNNKGLSQDPRLAIASGNNNNIL